MLTSDCFDMDPVAAVTANSLSSTEAVEAALANNAVGGSAAQTQAQKLGLPPVGLAAAAAANTIDAQLVSTLWSINPASVSGVYGGATEPAGPFSGDTLLALLQSLPAANAEQSLALLGIPTPSFAHGAGSTTAKPATNANAVAAAAAPSSGGSDVGTTVDPLWGVRA
jgi:hypothetical protein